MKSTTKRTISSSRRIQALVAATAFLFVRTAVATAQTETVLYSFAGGTDGASPHAGLVLDTQGNLYGTTTFGGADCTAFIAGCGTVFALSPTGTKTILHVFAGAPTDGSAPDATLVRDLRGNLYGTTAGGGCGRSPLFSIATDFRHYPTISSARRLDIRWIAADRHRRRLNGWKA